MGFRSTTAREKHAHNGSTEKFILSLFLIYAVCRLC